MWRLGFKPCTPGWNSKTTTTTQLLLLLHEAIAGPLDLTIGGGWLVLPAAEENRAAANEHDGDHRSRGSPAGVRNLKAGPGCARGAAVEGACLQCPSTSMCLPRARYRTASERREQAGCARGCSCMLGYGRGDRA